jgi:hypothetical protein
MSHFIDGFSDELEKLAVVGAVAKGAKALGKLIMKHPGKALTVGLVGAGGVAGALAASSARKRRIAASSRGPSEAWYVNYHKALGLPRQLTKLERERLSRHFARYRERQ